MSRASSTARGWVKRLGFVRTVSRWSNARRYLPDWTHLGITSPHTDAGGSRVLLATMVGGNLQAAELERVLSAALSLRGHHVDTVICDKALPACIECSYVVMSPEAMADRGPQGSICGACTSTGVRGQHGTGSTVHLLSRWISDEDRAEASSVRASVPPGSAADLRVDGIAVGEHAVAATLRFLAVASLPTDETTQRILDRYIEAAVILVRAAQRMLAELKPDVVVMQHGIYVPQGIMLEVAKQRGVRVVAWATGYPKQTILFSHGDTYHRTMLQESPSDWESAPWDEHLARLTTDYLDSRRTGSADWMGFSAPDRSADGNSSSLAQENRPLVVAMANVSWDAQLHFDGRAYPTQAAWILATIDWARTRPDLALVIRAHPAEITGFLPSRDPLRDTVKASTPPQNVYFVDADSDVSTYDLIEAANCVIVYGTKVGVEALARSTPVINVGEAWVRNKGLSIDVDSPSAYAATLAQLPFAAGLDPAMHEKSLRYAHHLFLRRMIPIRALAKVQNRGPGAPLFYADVASPSDLAAGTDPGLDAVCDGIVTGSAFVRRQE